MKKLCSATMLVFFSILSAQAQFTTQGKDFWLSFGRNYSGPMMLQIRIITTAKTKVTFTFSELGTTSSITLNAGTVYTKSLIEQETRAVYSIDNEISSKKSLRIQTDEDVTVYAINLEQHSTDATIVLPIQALGTSYYHASYHLNGVEDGYTLVASENNTTIYKEGENIVSLNKGEVFSSYFDENKSGIHITSSKPIAYFTTNTCVNIPVGYSACDCLYEQLFPVSSWGSKFMIPVTIQGTERVRIFASQNGTTIVKTGGKIIPGIGKASLQLNAGEYVELEVNQSEAGCYVESDKPIGVVSFLTGNEYVKTEKGDPALAWIPSVEQFAKEIIISPFMAAGSSQLKEHHILITVPTKYKSHTFINSDAYSGPLEGGNWTDHPSGYSYYSLPLTANSAYGITNPYGIAVMGYGLGLRESYYYLAGAATRKLDASFYVNDIHYQDIDGASICGIDSIRMNAELNYETSSLPGHIRWFINGKEEIASVDKLEWIKKPLLSGTYSVTMIVNDKNNKLDTASCSFTITTGFKADVDGTTVCSGESATLNIKNPAVGAVYQWYRGVIPVHTGINYTTPPLSSNTYYYVGTGCANEIREPVKVEVITVNVAPDQLPAYKFNVAYEVQLTSDATNPVFSHIGDLPHGLSLTSSGLISGTVPTSEDIEDKTIVVTVTNKNGCKTEKEYTFFYCEPAPDVPFSEISYCQGEQAAPLEASSPAGLPLQWYTGDQKTKIDYTPIPDTRTPGTQVYYVVQKNLQYSCEGAKAKITVTVHAAPENDFTATSEAVCFGTNPVISLKGLNPDYTYEINRYYLPSISVSGTSSKEVELEQQVSDLCYIRAKNQHGCMSNEYKTVHITVHYVQIGPYELPPYIKNFPYEAQLWTNVENPTFSYTGNLLTGLIVSSTGRISGTVPASANDENATFTVTVEDKNGCRAEKEYRLYGCTRVPEAYDVTLCQGSEASPLNAWSLDYYPLQWYAADQTTELPEAIPDTSIPGEQVFYVAQRNPFSNCIGEKKKVTVTVSARPALDFEAVANNICAGNQPVILLSGLNGNYRYDASFTDDFHYVGSIQTGGSSTGRLIINDIPQKTTSYNISVYDNNGCVSDGFKKVTVNVISSPTILPDELPRYVHDVSYNVQLSSNLTDPVFDYAGSLVTGISITNKGLISGTVPTSAGAEGAEFIVSVVDENGCSAEKQYLLRSCEAAPDVPRAELRYCEGAKAEPLTASSAAGWPLQWYASNKTSKLDKAPTPNTSIPGEQVYYVAQVNNLQHCEGTMAKIIVTVDPAPGLDFGVVANTICRGESPVLSMTGVQNDYIYRVYSDKLLTGKLVEKSGVSSASIPLNTKPDQSAAYYITATDLKGCTSVHSKEVTLEVVSLNILPESLPVYRYNEAYHVQLTSNATNAVFKTVDKLLTGISMNPEGLLQGTVPESAEDKSTDFTVTVEDQQGCKTDKRYTLRSCDPAPIVESSVAYCKGSKATPLTAKALNGLSLQWYDGEYKKLPAAPSPATNTTGIVRYYVSQINSVLNCESDKAEIVVQIRALPEIDFSATAQACYQGSTSILLENLDVRFKYDLYSEKNGSNKITSLTGRTSDLLELNDVLEKDRSYYISVTNTWECMSADYLEVKVNVIKPEIGPDKLPNTGMNTEYVQQLTSNIDAPLFTLEEGQLPDGITLSSSGLLSGKTSSLKQAVFTVMVEDPSSGCKATRKYSMNELFIPQVFTPNGNGINDTFMKGFKVVIFDRLGITIHSGDNGWDGMYKGKPAPKDIYFYKLYHQNDEGSTTIRTGYIGLE